MDDKQTQGLTSQEVEEQRRLYGANILTPPEKTPLWVRFLEKFKDPIIIILLVAYPILLIIFFIFDYALTKLTRYYIQSLRKRLGIDKFLR